MNNNYANTDRRNFGLYRRRPTDFVLKEEKSVDKGAVSKPKTLTDIKQIMSDLRSAGLFVVPVGKTAEVARGLYDTTHSLQFYVILEEGSVESSSPQYLTLKVENAARRVIGDLNHNFVHFTNKGGRGVVTPFGLIFISMWVYEGDCNSQRPSTYINDDYFDKSGLINIRTNHDWWVAAGYYDSEMTKSKHYQTVVDFVTKNQGDNNDVVAVRALFTFAEKRDEASLVVLEEKLKAVHSRDPYQDFVDEIKNVAKL